MAALFILVGLLCTGFALWHQLGARLQTNRRLRRLAARPGQIDLGAALEWRLPPSLESLAIRSGLDPARLPTLAGGAALAGAFLTLPFLAAWWVPVGALVGVALLLAVLQMRAERRRRAIGTALPGFMDRLRQQLTVGASAAQALERAVVGSPPAIREVFAPALWRLRHGASLNESLIWLAQRECSSELGALASAIAASSRFGGKLGEALGNLARTLRDRQRVEQEMKAATAEVRASSFVLASLPLLVALAMLFVSDSFREHFAGGGGGNWLLPWLGAAYLIGVLLMRRIARPSF